MEIAKIEEGLSGIRQAIEWALNDVSTMLPESSDKTYEGMVGAMLLDAKDNLLDALSDTHLLLKAMGKTG